MFSSTEKKAEKAYQAAGALLRKSSSAENRKKAGELYLTAAKLGHADAQFRYGALILRAEYAEDPAPGFAWVEKAARQGHAGALELCVEMYSGARGHLTPDLAKAAEWAQMAREFGIEKARFSDWGVSINETKAMYWYEKAAEGGDPEAQFRYARHLYTKKKDLLGALSLLEKAMLQGHSGALALYRKIYLPGGIEDFLKECAERAQKGDAWAGFLCAEFLSRGGGAKGRPQNAF